MLCLFEVILLEEGSNVGVAVTSELGMEPAVDVVFFVPKFLQM